MNSRSAIVFGGGGFIGTNLCRRLVSSGFKVRAFGRRRLFPDALPDVEWVNGDISDISAVTRALEPGSIAYHLIHSVLPHAVQQITAETLETAPTRQLLEACHSVGTIRVVFVSSGGTVYGNAAQIPTTEDAPTAPFTPYGRSNLAIEQCLALQRQQHGLEYRVLRAANPYGPFQTANKQQGVIAALIKNALRGNEIDIWGDGSVIRDFVYVDDLANALLLAASDRSPYRVFNIGSGRGRSLREVIAMIENALQKPIKINWQPGRPSDIPVSVVAIARAKKEFGWEPKVDFVEGLQRTISWWRQC